jgi:hypothetical protein
MTRMAWKGTVVGKTVVIEEGAGLPDGAAVEVRLVSDRVAATSHDARARALQRLLSLELPVDDWTTMEDEVIRGATEG